MRTKRRHEASKRDRPDRSGSSYAGINRIKFAGSESISAQQLRTPGRAKCTRLPGSRHDSGLFLEGSDGPTCRRATSTSA